jgi:hypothetical protein
MIVPPPQVVLFPDLIVHGLCNHEPSRLVLERWRDGRIRPVTSRGLLERYLKAFAGLGLKDVALRRWIWWFTSTEHSVYVQRSAADACTDDGVRLCSVLAEETHSPVVYAQSSSGWPPSSIPAQGDWIAAQDFLQR